MNNDIRQEHAPALNNNNNIYAAANNNNANDNQETRSRRSNRATGSVVAAAIDGMSLRSAAMANYLGSSSTLPSSLTLSSRFVVLLTLRGEDMKNVDGFLGAKGETSFGFIKTMDTWFGQSDVFFQVSNRDHDIIAESNVETDTLNPFWEKPVVVPLCRLGTPGKRNLNQTVYLDFFDHQDEKKKDQQQTHQYMGTISTTIQEIFAHNQSQEPYMLMVDDIFYGKVFVHHVEIKIPRELTPQQQQEALANMNHPRQQEKLERQREEEEKREAEEKREEEKQEEKLVETQVVKSVETQAEKVVEIQEEKQEEKIEEKQPVVEKQGERPTENQEEEPEKQVEEEQDKQEPEYQAEAATPTKPRFLSTRVVSTIKDGEKRDLPLMQLQREESKKVLQQQRRVSSRSLTSGSLGNSNASLLNASSHHSSRSIDAPPPPTSSPGMRQTMARGETMPSPASLERKGYEKMASTGDNYVRPKLSKRVASSPLDQVEEDTYMYIPFASGLHRGYPSGLPAGL